MPAFTSGCLFDKKQNSLLSPGSHSLFVLNCLCANIFSTVSSLLWTLCCYYLCGQQMTKNVTQARILSILLCVCHNVVSPPLFHYRISFGDPPTFYSLVTIFVCVLIFIFNIRNHLRLLFWLHSCQGNRLFTITRLFIR